VKALALLVRSLAFGAGAAAGCGGEAGVLPQNESGWRTISAAPLSPRSSAAAAWTGERIIIVGGENLDVWQGPDDRRFRAGYSYNPRTRTTIRLATEWFSDAAAYDPAADRWERLPPSPLAAAGSAALWTGREVLIWGGSGSATTRSLTGSPTIPFVGAGAGLRASLRERALPGARSGLDGSSSCGADTTTGRTDRR
jgi:hypothetical protein